MIFAHFTFMVCICITPRVLLQIQTYEKQRKLTQIFTTSNKIISNYCTNITFKQYPYITHLI